MNQVFPHDMKSVSEEELELMKNYFKGDPLIRIGPHGYIYRASHKDNAAHIYNLEVKPDDIWVTSFPRSGTTWTQELVWLIVNDLDFDKALSKFPADRYVYLEYPPHLKDKDGDYHRYTTRETCMSFPTLPSPRFVKCHSPLSLLPPKLLDVAKVFYVARHPCDVVVSYCFVAQMFSMFQDKVEIKKFWEYFKKDLLLYTPLFSHVEEAWKQRNHPNFMFLFYEEMQKDLPGVIDRMCKFLNKDYTAEQKKKLAEFVNFKNMQKNLNLPRDDDNIELHFVRKGKCGAWVDYFDEDMRKEAEEYMENYYRHTDLRYPTM